MNAQAGPVRTTYLPQGLPAPLDEEGVNAPYWNGLREGVLRVQRCTSCLSWQFGGEHLCHHCHAWDPPWVAVQPRGRIYSWERVWHPAHPALLAHGPYLAVLVELPQAGHLRMLGNLLGDALQTVVIGAEVEGVFEPHPQNHPQSHPQSHPQNHLQNQPQTPPPYSLLQWRLR